MTVSYQAEFLRITETSLAPPSLRKEQSASLNPMLLPLEKTQHATKPVQAQPAERRCKGSPSLG